MICFNKLHFITSTLIITLSLVSCNQDKKSSVIAQEFVDMSSSTIFLSNDNKHEFVVIANPGSDNGEITVHDSKDNKEYTLKRVKSGVGVQYESENGYVLWTKGSEFTWSKDEETIAKGYLKTTEFEAKKEVEVAKLNSSNYGNYVNADYSNKDDGTDWVAVIVKPIDDFKATVSVRSRGDKKKGTCTFDAIGNVSDKNTLNVFENGVNILFIFKPGSVVITTNPESENDKLAFFCSGGANFAGTYSKIDGELDKKQIDKTGYSKSLIYNDIFFSIEESGGVVTVTPRGLEIDKAEQYPINGEITNVEVDDLNYDTFPELLIYTKSGVDAHGKVLGFSVNNGKSMSRINISKVSDNEETNKGYQGRDEFAMVEGTFIQRFPIYENNSPTGKIKQIQYKLEEGESSSELVVNKIVEY
ncbi:MliC family protein [Formosa sp. PL04]|uniref:MliC family protein n=1 Tax=Formosa sp. PL04 TaxID=3081755 RepID=UPI00298225C7|nr:MliC family protein [Formosa sp. PL04]MDW5288636.1 MliC family protein [Formosa sp. PL04]